MRAAPVTMGTRCLGAERLLQGAAPLARLMYAMSKVGGERRAAEAAHAGKGEGLPSGARPQPQEPQAVQTNRPGRARQPRSQASAPPNRIPMRRRGQLANESYEGPPGVQGANVGYWQAGGVTRAGAKRSKRP